jgi:hypothetical protein
MTMLITALSRNVGLKSSSDSRPNSRTENTSTTPPRSPIYFRYLLMQCNPVNLQHLMRCFSTFVTPRPGKFIFYKTRVRSQQIIGLQAIFMTGHKRRYSLYRMLKDFDVWKFPITHEYFHVWKYAAWSLTYATQMLRRSGSELFDTLTNIILLRIFPL